MRSLSARRGPAGLFAAGLLLAGCAGPAPTGDGGGDPAAAPQLVAELRPGDAGEVADAVNQFGFDLLGEVADGGDNVITSPVSVATLLAMVLAGAGGDTAEAMADVLHLEDSRDVRVGALLDQLVDTDDVALSVANAVWGGEGVPFEPAYLDFVRDTFDATVEEADLGAQDTADTVDAWVAEHTEGRIEEIASDLGLPDPQAVLLLLNAVYFQGEWTTRFEPDNTVDQAFTLADGEQVQVPLMHLRDEELEYAERDGYRMLRLPYGEQGRYGMEVLLPDEGVGLGAVLEELDATEWRAAADGLTDTTVQEFALPRFELRWEATLTEPLSRLGMGPALGGGADLSRMSAADPSLDVVAHKTYLRVDEAGTEAAAVTGGVGITSAPADPLVFRVDRPFAFTISDSETGTVLFLGTVADPRG